jgi:uncharacterized protein
LKLFVDTWGWLALEDKKELRHRATAACYEERSKAAGRIMTSNFVLAETFTLLFRRRPFDEAWRFANALVGSPFIAVEPVTDARFRKTLELRRKLSDKPKISFTDLSSMVIMSEMRLTDVLSGDKHFEQVGLGFRIFPD